MAPPRTPLEIDDPDDPRIADYRNIRERDLVGRRGLFVAEGEVVLRLLARAPQMETLSVLVAASRVERLAETLAPLPETVPVYAARQPVLDAIAGFPLHRGILALGRRRSPPTADALLGALPPRALVLGLHGIANHDNMGALFRNAAAFGADAVILDTDCCDPLYRKAIRVSVGASLVVPFARLDPAVDALDLLAAHRFSPIALSPSGASALRDLRRPERVAVRLGAAGPGLPASLLARAQSVRIPMAAGFDSLNVATASGIVLHHLASQLDEPA